MTETATQLVEGALRCVRDKGLASTTSRDIAAAAGVNLAGITYHFGSKEELLAEALLTAVRSALEPALEVLRQDIDPEARVVAALAALESSFAGAGGTLPAYVEALVHSRHSPVLASGLRQLLDELRGFLTAQMDELRARGYLPGWVEPEAMAALLVAMAHGVALQAVLDLGGPDPQQVGAQGLQLLLAARQPGRQS